MTTSGIEDVAMRLLGTFYDLSGHNPLRHVPIGAPESPPDESAAKAAGLEPGSTECDVAVRYLLNQSYIKETVSPSDYAITVQGIDRVRKMRGLADPASSRGGIRMSEKTQRRLLSLLVIAITAGLTRPLSRFVAEQIPERRGIGDDLKEAVLQGLVRMTAVVAASLLVRRLAGPR